MLILSTFSPYPQFLAGWFRFYDKKKEKFYYANLKTKQSSWTRPDKDPNFLNEDIIFNFNDNELKYLREIFDEVDEID